MQVIDFFVYQNENDMHIGCTQMHPVTLAAITIELVILGAQAALYLQRPHDRIRLGYVLLLLLLIPFNLANGLFPDASYAIPVHAQHIIVNGFGFLMASYFPVYFYRIFGLEKLRFFAVYGVPLFLLLPYLLFFVIGYSIHGDLAFTHRYGYIVPTAYTICLLVAIGRAIRFAYREQRNRHLYVEETAAYVAIMPWAAIAPVVYFGWGQLHETLFTNLGFLSLSAFLLYRSVSLGRAEQKQLESLKLVATDTDTIESNCQRYGLSPRETDVAILICQRLGRKEVADRLFISERTVDTHTQNIFVKANVVNRKELITKFNSV